MAIHLGRPLPDASRDRPGWRHGNPPEPEGSAIPTWSCSRWGLPCRCRYRPRGALLPHHFTLAAPSQPKGRARFGGVFLWHFPWGRPRRALPGTVLPWSPDFPPPPHGEGSHPAVWRSDRDLGFRPSQMPDSRRRSDNTSRADGNSPARLDIEHAITAFRPEMALKGEDRGGGCRILRAALRAEIPNCGEFRLDFAQG